MKGEKEIIRLLREEPGRGIELLAEQYGGLILTVVRRVLPGRPQDAEEVAADVLVRVWRSAGGLREETLRGFLIVTARNLALDRWRQLARRRELPLLEGDRVQEIAFWEALEADDAAQQLTETLLALPPPEGELFLRYYLLLETAAEIGARYKLSEGAVRARLRRTREKLARQMGKGAGWDEK